jgi:hypothetical protein
MSSTALPTTIDPLHAFIAGAFVARTPRPLPLVATVFDVNIDAGVAIVTTTRRFRNAEESSIEATITFPVPVHASLFDLTARIGERVLHAHARRRQAAREEYEGAIDAGKTAVLHEEVLRGVHMLSVAHVPPGAEVEVRSVWALTLTNIDGRGTLRIPLTVGDIYGRSTLPDSDDLVHGGQADMARLRVECHDGAVTLHGAVLTEGRADVPLNAPIDLAVAAWTPRDLSGRAADGRNILLRIEPAPSGDNALDVAILVDHSGSMNEPCSADNRKVTKHRAVSLGLATIARCISGIDAIDLWEFDDALDHIGSTPNGAERLGGRAPTEVLLGLIRKLNPPRGGTEIGSALARVIARSSARDILLITDGKSHALDVQALARAGRRISLVLVGEDSLEANVGHLSASTGGEIFVASGNDLTTVLVDALRSLRVPYVAPEPISGRVLAASARRGGMIIEASWKDASSEGAEPASIDMRAVAAVATSLVLPALTTEAAAVLAEAEGLVTHLTSLVLVDEAGDVQESLPATRKIALPTPRTAMAACAVAGAAPELDARARGGLHAAKRARSMLGDIGGLFSPPPDGMLRADFVEETDLSSIAGTIVWDEAPHKLQSGDLSMLPGYAEHAIREAAAHSHVAALAHTLGLDPVVLVIGLLAYAARKHRSAARLARAIFGGAIPASALAVARMLGIDRSAA